MFATDALDGNLIRQLLQMHMSDIDMMLLVLRHLAHRVRPTTPHLKK